MSGKFTYSKSIPVWNITTANKTKQIATSPIEVVYMKLISAGGGARVSVYDTATGSINPADLKWSLDSSTYTNDDSVFNYPLTFTKGIYVVCDDGFAFNPVFCLAYLSDQV